MKVVSLRKKIIFNFSISFLLLLVSGGMVYLYINEEATTGEKINRITIETSEIRNKTSDLESQAAEIDKHKITWQQLSTNKKNVGGIKVDEFNSTLDSVAKKYLITTSNVKINLPEPLKDGIFARQTVDILFTTVSINFTSINDTMAIAFVMDFMNSLQGYQVITNFDLKKTKNYSAQDLLDVSFGKSPGFVTGKIEFFWYVSKESIKSQF
jgi:hypothetical protein